MKRNIKPLIYVFCEGESEIEYAKFLKEKYAEAVVMKKPVKGLFEEASNKFKKDVRYRNNAEITDEIWFFFDVDGGQTGSWNKNKKILSALRKLRRKPNIRIRLLMTTGCVEYWFLLHYKKISPSIQNLAEKERVLEMLTRYCDVYKKGDSKAIRKIAENFKDAAINGKWILEHLEGLPTLEDTDARNQWLYQSSLTFTTVHEAIEFLESL